MHYVYMLKKPGTKLIYIGYSADLKRRMREHQDREHPGWILVYYEAYLAEADARGRERVLKHYGNVQQLLKKRLRKSLAVDGSGGGSSEPKSR